MSATERRYTGPRLDPRRVVLRRDVLRVEQPRGDGWELLFEEALEVPSHRTRELARLLRPGGPVPVRPLRDAEGVRRLLTQLLGEDVHEELAPSEA